MNIWKAIKTFIVYDPLPTQKNEVFTFPDELEAFKLLWIYLVKKCFFGSDSCQILIDNLGVSPDELKINEPKGIALDKFGNLFVADNVNHRIQKVLLGVQIIIPAVTLVAWYFLFLDIFI